MRNIEAWNKRLACTPFEVHSVEAKVQSGFATVQQKSDLTVLEVVYPDGESYFSAGDRIYVRGESVKLLWAKEVFEVDGRKVIFVPIEAVVLVEREDVSW